MTDAIAIAVSGLVKQFGHVRALDGLDLSVARGEVHGFLGPNGAGKSTTLRVLLGLLSVEAGSATVFGLDPWLPVPDPRRAVLDQALLDAVAVRIEVVNA